MHHSCTPLWFVETRLDQLSTRMQVIYCFRDERSYSTPMSPTHEPVRFRPGIRAMRSEVGLTLLEPQSRFGNKPLKFQAVCPQNGTAVLKGLRAPVLAGRPQPGVPTAVLPLYAWYIGKTTATHAGHMTTSRTSYRWYSWHNNSTAGGLLVLLLCSLVPGMVYWFLSYPCLLPAVLL